MPKEKSDIIKDYQKKIKLIKKYNKLYYNDDSPLISDSGYDKLKKEIVDLEDQNRFLKNLDQ